MVVTSSFMLRIIRQQIGAILEYYSFLHLPLSSIISVQFADEFASFSVACCVQATEPRRCEVRGKITNVVSKKGCEFDVQYRNGNVWHLSASNLVSLTGHLSL